MSHPPHPPSLPLLATKLMPLRLRPALILRPRLARLLDAAVAQPVTLISAPAGFGKTTSAAAWAQGGRCRWRSWACTSS